MTRTDPATTPNPWGAPPEGSIPPGAPAQSPWTATPPPVVGVPPASAAGGTTKPPLYWRLLRLRQVQPNGWQRATLVEGVVGLSVVLVLADVASAWTLLILPLTSAAVVKAHDLLAEWLRAPRRD